MEVFLMAAISRGGLTTFYSLQQYAGLQPGSIKQVIKQLEETGLLERSAGAKRGRRNMALTGLGHDLLAVEWRNCLDPQREMESVLRSATVALLMGEIGVAINYLLRSVSEREKRQGPPELRAATPDRTPIDLHAEVRTLYENRRRAMEADALRQFAGELDANGSTMVIPERAQQIMSSTRES
jgi:DNA-binding MarR family transcriptional regulator